MISTSQQSSWRRRSQIMRKIESNMMESIRWADRSADGRIFKLDNTEAELYHTGIFGTLEYDRHILIKLHGNLIAKIDDVYNGAITLYAQGYHTKTTKSRINAILNHFAPKYGIYQHNYVWYISKQNKRYIEFYDGVTIFPSDF